MVVPQFSMVEGDGKPYRIESFAESDDEMSRGPWYLGRVDEHYASSDDELRYLVYRTGAALHYVSEDSPAEDGFNGFYASLQRTLSLPRLNLNEEQKSNFLRMCAHSLSTALEQDFGNAEMMAGDARTFLEETSRRVVSGRFLVSALVCSCVAVTVGLLLANFFWTEKDAYLLQHLFSFGLIGGGFGSLFSVLADRGGRLGIPLDADLTASLMHGGFRVLAGVVGSTIVLLAIVAGIFSEDFVGELNHLRLTFFATAAGFSERFATSVLARSAPPSG